MRQYGTDESIAAAPQQVLFDMDETSGIATITLNRPDKHNALSVPMRARLTQLMSDVEHDERIRVVIIRGNGPSFCSGNEINERWGQRRPHERRHTNTIGYRYSNEMAWGRPAFSQALGRSSKVTIAQVHGFCAAAAYFMIVTKVDLVVASEDASIGALEARFLGPAGAVANIHINRTIGMKAARRTGYTAVPMSAGEAAGLGLISRVVPRDELESTTWAVAGELAERDPATLLFLKSRLRMSDSLLDIPVPAITGMLISHFLQSAPDELDFWSVARDEGVGGALRADKARKGAIDPRKPRGSGEAPSPPLGGDIDD